MSEWGFSEKNAKIAAEAVEEIFSAIPKTRRMLYLGRLNDVLLFLDAAKEHIPEKGRDDGSKTLL